jgi:hypothetical protein
MLLPVSSPRVVGSRWCTLSGDGFLACAAVTGMAPHHAHYPATNCHQVPPTQPREVPVEAYHVPHANRNVDIGLVVPDTPGRKRSQPIAIELPSRSLPKVYTPLSARGDLPGYAPRQF